MTLDHAVSEPIDLSDVRAYLSMDDGDTSQDAVLTESISFCRDRLEAVLPYYIAEREVRVNRDLCTWCIIPCVDIELRGPVIEVVSVDLVLADGSVLPAGRDCWTLFNSRLTVNVRRAMEEGRADATGHGRAEGLPNPVGVTVVYRAGSHVPPVVKNALLMMVRNRYERRDEDPLTEAVMSSVYSETRPNI